jgi:DNA invertase Pin-like site-specific DNA recombinase
VERLDGYIRVSRVGGREGESFISPKVQRQKIEAWAKLHDVVLGEIVEELDISGGSAPETRRLETLLVRCEKGASQGIVCWRVDRFSRDAADTLAAVRRLRDSGARLVGVDDGVDSASPGGKLVLTVMAGLAEEQLDRVRESWRVARAEAAKRGVYLAGHAPTGYVRGENGSLVPNPEVAPVIAEAFARRAAGASFTEVADFLSDSGVLPRAGLRKNGGTRSRWSREGARQLLRNPVYSGKPRESNSAATVEAIVSPQQWRAAQIPVRVYSAGNGRTQALLVGLIKCGGCGHALHAVGRGPSYSCRGKFASGVCTARANASVARVDAYVEDLFWRTLESGEAPVSDAAAQTRFLEAREAAEKAEAELDAWVEDASMRELLGDAKYRRGIEARQEALDTALRTLWETPDPGIPDDALIVSLTGKPTVHPDWEGKTIAERRAFLRRYLEQVTLHRADPTRRKWQPIEERVELRWVGEAVAA